MLVKETDTTADSFGSFEFGVMVILATGLAFSTTAIVLLEIVPQTLVAVTLYEPDVTAE